MRKEETECMEIIIFFTHYVIGYFVRLVASVVASNGNVGIHSLDLFSSIFALLQHNR